MTSYEEHLSAFEKMVDGHHRSTTNHASATVVRSTAASAVSPQSAPVNHNGNQNGPAAARNGPNAAPGFVRTVGFGAPDAAEQIDINPVLPSSLPRQINSQNAGSQALNKNLSMSVSPLDPADSATGLSAVRSGLPGWKKDSSGETAISAAVAETISGDLPPRPSARQKGESKAAGMPGTGKGRSGTSGKDENKLNASPKQQQHQQQQRQKSQQQQHQEQQPFKQQQKGQQQPQQQQKGQQLKDQQQQKSNRPPREGTGSSAASSVAPGAQAASKKGRSSAPSSAPMHAVATRPAPPAHQVWGMLSHLQVPKPVQVISNTLNPEFPGLHPAIVELGVKYANGSITGSTARAVALLLAMREVVEDFEIPEGVFLFKDLDIRPLISHVVKCRPMSVSMGVCVKYIKSFLAASKAMSTQAEAKDYVLQNIDEFLRLRIDEAVKEIANIGASKIADNDVILTFGRSYSVEAILKLAHARNKKFRVVIVDSGPRFEGKEMLRRLISHGVGECSYSLVAAASYVMKDATKVIVGAHTVTANGALISRCGTAQVAAVAHYHRVPFLVACETYKFTERVHTESFSYNELGDPSDVVADLVEADAQQRRERAAAAAAAAADGGGVQRPGSKRSTASSDTAIADEDANVRCFLAAAIGPNKRGEDGLLLLNLTYDLTPVEYISALLTEHGMIPTTAVPVLLREQAREQAEELKRHEPTESEM